MEFEIREAFEILERTPGVLASLLQGLATSWVTSNEGPDTFSPMDVLGHLIHGEKTDWVERIKLILEHGESKAFQPFDQSGHLAEIEGTPSGVLLQEFHALRMKNLRYVHDLKLDDDMLALTGTHPELGTVTMQQLISTWAVHDLSHIGQIVRVMAHQYAAETGPWKKYLRILPD
jgi:hypothetical protein